MRFVQKHFLLIEISKSQECVFWKFSRKFADLDFVQKFLDPKFARQPHKDILKKIAWQTRIQEKFFQKFLPFEDWIAQELCQIRVYKQEY